MRKSGFALLLSVICVVCALPTDAEEPVKRPDKKAIAQAQSGVPGGQTYGMPVDSSPATGGMIVSTTDSVDGYRIREYRGIVRGVMVREPNTIQSFKAGFQGIFGGKIGSYIHNCEQGRQAAYDAMVQQGQARGANAIVGVRYDSDSFQGGSTDVGTEIVCYGTAVIVEPMRAP